MFSQRLSMVEKNLTVFRFLSVFVGLLLSPFLSSDFFVTALENNYQRKTEKRKDLFSEVAKLTLKT